MTFISYAQNFEDVMLWRALKHIACGFYIDVGANDPDVDSVTKAFYERGWRGINIEPITQWAQKLKDMRPRDINLQLAAGAEQGELIIYELPDTGLSTVNKEIAERHEIERGYRKLERIVPVETITSICNRFHVSPIHFLKIDVEGAEKDVLHGIDFSIIRPWIVVVESTIPNSQTEDYSEWEFILCEANYQYVYFDGLNRYYLAQEHHELKMYFYAPPNFFDEFISCQQLASELRAQAAEGATLLAETRATEAEAQASEYESRTAEARQLAQQVQAQAQEEQAQAQQAANRAAEAEAQCNEIQQKLNESFSNAHNWYLRATDLESRLQSTQQQLDESLSNAHNWYLRATDLESQLHSTQQELDKSLGNAHLWHLQANMYEARNKALVSSTSWRITWPLRILKIALVWLLLLPWRLLKLLIKPFFNVGMRMLLDRPSLRRRFSKIQQRYPRIYSHLNMYALSNNLLPTESAAEISSAASTETPISRGTDECSLQSATEITNTAVGPDVNEQGTSVGEIAIGQEKVDEETLVGGFPAPPWMTSHARRIYADLKSAVEQRQKENG